MEEQGVLDNRPFSLVFFRNEVLNLVNERLSGGPDIQLSSQLVDTWLFDLVDRDDILKRGWWSWFDEYAFNVDSHEAATFMANLLAVFYVRLGNCDQKLLYDIVDACQRRRAERFKAEGYYELIIAIQHEIWKAVPVICIIGGHASGDMFGIGASGLLKDDLAVAVYTYHDRDQDHSDGMIQFFSELMTGTRLIWTDDYSKLFDVKAPALFERMKWMQKFCWLAPYNMGTYFLSSKFKEPTEETDVRDVIRSGFKVERINETTVKYVEKLLLPFEQLSERRCIVLWSRFTGKKGEYHPEHDTSFKGMAQLAWLAAGLGYHVIIAGDKPLVHGALHDGARRAQHFDEICRSINAYFEAPRCFNITEFWTNPEWRAISGKSRLLQFQVYELLHRHCDVRHLGMRSGNLEAMALLGYFVRYMEEEDSYGGDRMVAWHGTDIGYERIILIAPPTRVGKSMHFDSKRGEKPVSMTFIPPYIKSRNRGFPNTSSRTEQSASQKVEQTRLKFAEILQRVKEEAKQGIKERCEREIKGIWEKHAKENEKPELTMAWNSGFLVRDLLEIRNFMLAEHPCSNQSGWTIPLVPTPDGDEQALANVSTRQWQIWRSLRGGPEDWFAPLRTRGG